MKTIYLKKSIFLLLSLVFSFCAFAESADVKIIDDKGKTIESKKVELQKNEDAIRLTIAKEDVENARMVRVYPSFTTAKVGENGFIVLANGMLTEFKPRENCEFTHYRPIMPISGIKTSDKAYLALVRGMQFDCAPIVSLKNGVYSLAYQFGLKRYKPYEDLIIDFYPINAKDATYSAMARKYRSIKLKTLKPLSERISGNKYLDYATNSLELRIRQGWKPAPSPVMDQNLQNEPKMYAKVPFDKVGEILDALKEKGVEKAQVCLVGWNRMGHDGRYPQIFPVEPKLGGETKLRELIKKAKSNGYQIVCHTNPTSAYPVSELWDKHFVAKKKDGSAWERPIKQPWSGGRSYFMCMKTSFEQFAKKDFPKMRDLGFEGLHYLDVVSIVEPQICYDPNHKLNSHESAKYCNELMKLAKETFGGAQSEGGYDHVAENTDFALYITFNMLGKQPKIVDKVVPIWQLVYHGIIMSNPSSETVNYTAKDKKTIMKNLEFGARPTFYMYSAFFEAGKKKNWMGDIDIKCATKEEFNHAIECIAKGYEDVKKYSYLQTQFFEEHSEIAKDVIKCVYSDGSEFIFNYAQSPFIYNGKTIPSMDFKLFKPKSFWDKLLGIF